MATDDDDDDNVDEGDTAWLDARAETAMVALISFIVPFPILSCVLECCYQRMGQRVIPRNEWMSVVVWYLGTYESLPCLWVVVAFCFAVWG